MANNRTCCNHDSFISANNAILYTHKTYGKFILLNWLNLSLDSTILALNFQKNLLKFGSPTFGAIT